ncbi:hypothetical protein AA105894_2694 [Asaia spathodeae NBRC 105894]|nr:hypothetical protein AA105894_2694 [Asaia spathodeae NBRC 105894]
MSKQRGRDKPLTAERIAEMLQTQQTEILYLRTVLRTLLQQSSRQAMENVCVAVSANDGYPLDICSREVDAEWAQVNATDVAAYWFEAADEVLGRVGKSRPDAG